MYCLCVGFFLRASGVGVSVFVALCIVWLVYCLACVYEGIFIDYFCVFVRAPVALVFGSVLMYCLADVLFGLCVGITTCTTCVRAFVALLFG